MLPTSFWEEEKKRLLGLLQPQLEGLAIDGVKAGTEKLRAVGIEFDDSLANAAAARWAREKAGELVDLVNGTSQKVVGEIVGNWVETPGATIGDLAHQLAPSVGDNADRAFNVAVTETTTCYANGEALVYEAAGIPRAVFLPSAHPRCRCWPSTRRFKIGDQYIWLVIWQTNRDEIVCRTSTRTPWGMVEGCRELHNRVLSEGPWLGKKVSEVG